MTRVLAVLADLPTRAEIRRMVSRLPDAAIALLVLNREVDPAEAERVFQAEGLSIERRLEGLVLLQAAVPIAREKFKKFVAQWPSRYRKNGKTFGELFVYEGRLSLWWLTELCLKNNEARPTFGYLIKLEALRLVLAEDSFDHVVLLARNPDLRDILTQLGRSRRMRVVATDVRDVSSGGSLLRLLGGRAKSFLMDVVATLAAQASSLVNGRGPTTLETQDAVAFHTWYPSEWLDWKGQFLDRYYVDLPQFLERDRGCRTVYVATSRPAGKESLVKVAAGALSGRSKLARAPVIMLARFISLLRLCAIYCDVRVALRYLLLERFDPSFRATFGYEDVNIFRIARHDLRVSLVSRIPALLVQAHQVRNVMKRMKCRTLVTYLELYDCGRAMIYGARTSGVRVRTVGYQHSRITRNQLLYNFEPGQIVGRAENPNDMIANMPIPDDFILHGSHAWRVLAQGGFPRERLRVCGCPRFDDLAELRVMRKACQGETRRKLGIRDGKGLIVIATAYWVSDTRQLVDLVFDATAGHDNVCLLFKPHPNHRAIEKVVECAARRTGQRGFTLTFESLHVLATAADVVVTVNSTSGAEALAVGCPVVNVRLTDVDLSPFVETTDMVPEAYNASQLGEVLGAILTGSGNATGAPEVIEGVFYKLDGQSKERVASVLAEEY